jgi:hypothetical protein
MVSFSSNFTSHRNVVIWLDDWSLHPVSRSQTSQCLTFTRRWVGSLVLRCMAADLLPGLTRKSLRKVWLLNSTAIKLDIAIRQVIKRRSRCGHQQSNDILAIRQVVKHKLLLLSFLRQKRLSSSSEEAQRLRYSSFSHCLGRRVPVDVSQSRNEKMWWLSLTDSSSRTLKPEETWAHQSSSAHQSFKIIIPSAGRLHQTLLPGVGEDIKQHINFFSW